LQLLLGQILLELSEVHRCVVQYKIDYYCWNWKESSYRPDILLK